MSTDGTAARTRKRLGRLGALLRLVWETDPRRATLGAVLMLSTALVGGMASLALKALLDALVDRRWSFALTVACVTAVLQGVNAVAGRASFNVENILAAIVGMRVNRDVLALTSSLPGIEHYERPEFLDRIEMVRDKGVQLASTLWTIGNGAALALRIGITLGLLASVHPLLLLLPLFAVPSVLLAVPAQRAVAKAQARSAELQRRATHLHGLFVDPSVAKELRVFECADALNERADTWWREAQRVLERGELRATAISSLGWATFALGFVGSLFMAARGAVRGGGTAGDLLLVWQLASQVRGQVSMAEGTVRGVGAAFSTLDRLVWLTEYVDEQRADAGTEAPPESLVAGIRFEDVSFTYPGTDEPVLDHVTFDVPPGSTFAIVGENGAGKTTLVKLLAGFYRPTSGHILVDGVDLADIDHGLWQRRLSGVFQDFAKLEVSARDTVAVGDLDRADDDAVVAGALRAADAQALVDGLADGERTLLGLTYHAGVELSGGQWQKLAVARAMMPAAPLLLLLDEPTAALDPASEHTLFERYANAAASARRPDGATVLVSHRFSTVRMADRILVMEGGRLVQQGTHIELLAAGGLYADMFEMQAQAYR
jgi:ATP-binding cassette subfamily B protein